MPAIPIRYSTVSSANACNGSGTTNLTNPDFSYPGSNICDSDSVSDPSFYFLTDYSYIWIALEKSFKYSSTKIRYFHLWVSFG